MKSNIVNRLYNLNTLQSLALTGFLLGNDNFDEEVIGVDDNIQYDGDLNYYHITVFLRETANHTSTSGIGFYIKAGNILEVYSSKVVLRVGITEDMQTLLDKAKESHRITKEILSLEIKLKECQLKS